MTVLAKDLVKTKGIITAGPEDSLASALNKIHSSHDAVFVVDNKKQLLGVISAYQVTYRSHKPAGTKVKNCLFLAPKLKPETKIDQIARLMLESKIYFLPVVTAGGKWLGIVSFRSLLRQITGIKIQPKTLTVCRENISLGQARNLMKKSGYSKLIIVNPSGRLTGIVTRSDLSGIFNAPPETTIAQFIKRSVVTCRPQDNPDALIPKMIDRKIGSVILVNNKFHPVGIFSISDCLKSLSRPNQTTSRPMTVRLNQVRSGFEAFARQGQTVAHAFGRFKKQAIQSALKKLRQRLKKI